MERGVYRRNQRGTGACARRTSHARASRGLRMRRGARGGVNFYQKPISPVICASKGSSAPLGPSPPTNEENRKCNSAPREHRSRQPGTPEVPRRRRVLHPRVPSVCPPPRAVQAQPPRDIFCLHSASFSAQEEVSVSGQVAQGCWQPRQPSERAGGCAGTGI